MWSAREGTVSGSDGGRNGAGSCRGCGTVGGLRTSSRVRTIFCSHRVSPLTLTTSKDSPRAWRVFELAPADVASPPSWVRTSLRRS